MFDKFGEFNSVEEINAKARELKEAQDKDGLYALATENGMPAMDVDDYMDGLVEQFTMPIMAALGKIEAESKDIGVDGILVDWEGILKEMCSEDLEMAAAVRRKGKRLAEYMARLLRYAFETKVQISDKIVDITMVNHNGKEEKMRKPLYLGVPNKAQVKKLAREYYMGDAK